MKKLSTLTLLLCLSFFSFAQSDCNCCTEQHRLFDFWAGDWEVFDTTGTKVGENLIHKLEKNCILNEYWRSEQGGTGRSYNYFDPADSTWNQIWLDSWGSNLVLKGHAEENKMILKSKLLPGKKIDWYANRITWTNNEDGSVTQTWDIIDKNEKIISVAFKGIYKRRKNESGDSAGIEKIKEQTKAIREKSKLSKTLKTNDKITSEAGDSSMMTIYTIDDKVSRILKTAVMETGTLNTEWFYQNGKPIFSYQTFEFEESKNDEALWKNFKGQWAWESRYYFDQDNIVYQIHTGKLIPKKYHDQNLLNEGKNLFTIASMFR